MGMSTSSPTATPPATPSASTKVRQAVASVADLASFSGKYRVLHLTWFAFFLSFVVWFNFAPFSTVIGQQMGLGKGELITLGLCNVALTVPSRIFIGMALDRFGPRRTYSAILLFAVIPCTAFALSQTFTQMVVSRLLLGVVGAGFVPQDLPSGMVRSTSAYVRFTSTGEVDSIARLFSPLL